MMVCKSSALECLYHSGDQRHFPTPAWHFNVGSGTVLLFGLWNPSHSPEISILEPRSSHLGNWAPYRGLNVLSGEGALVAIENTFPRVAHMSCRRLK